MLKLASVAMIALIFNTVGVFNLTRVNVTHAY